MDAKLKRQLEESWYLRKPMRAQQEDSAESAWLSKAVEAGREILLARDFGRLRMTGRGRLGLEKTMSKSGKGSVYLDFPVRDPVLNPSGRAYSEACLTIPFDREDLTAYNRISLWIYADAPGSSCNFMTLALHNAGPKIMPVPGRFEGSHSIMGESGKWFRVVWEIPNVARNCVTAITVAAQAYGTPVPSSERIRIYFDGLSLEKVREDPWKGFALSEESIAYCHSGYRTDGAKQALIGHPSERFFLVDDGGKAVYEGRPEAVKEGFWLLDFSDFDGEGQYVLRTDRAQSGRFPVGREAYLSAAWKTLNFFFSQRCGFDVPGVHTECHLDAMSVHPDGREKCVAGGWHDAGDLTQDSKNTAESALAMMELGCAAMEGEPWLGRRALEEARWGIDWLLRARWGDGYTHCGRIMGVWTQNAVGDCDDFRTAAENRPHNNLMTAGVFARAAEVFRKEDERFAGLCETCAREDYRFGVDAMHEPPGQSFSAMNQCQLNAQAACSAALLYRAFGEETWLEDAARFARIVMNCQQREAPEGFAIPLRGYFYETEEKKRVQAYFHRSYEHIPIRALALLVKLAPDHPEAPDWKESLELYAEYLKQIAKATPYGLLPAGVYEVGNADFSNLYHEGDRSQGAPTMEEYDAQVRNGIPLDETHFLRIFPAAFQFRGFHAPIMGKAIAAMELFGLTKDRELRDIAVRQMEWILGFNPFASSSMYGEGYRFHPLYSGVMPQTVGAVPVGFEFYENEDEPYYPVQNLPTYKEIWVHTTCRMMRLIAYLGFGEEKSGKENGG